MYSIVANKPGDTSVLQRKSIFLTDLKSNEILIKNRAIGVNFIDIYFRAGLYPWPVAVSYTHLTLPTRLLV